MLLEIKNTHTIWKGSDTNEDLKKTVRYLESKTLTFAELDAYVQETKASLELYEKEKIVDFKNMSLETYRKIAGRYISKIEYFFEEEKDNSNFKTLSIRIIAVL